MTQNVHFFSWDERRDIAHPGDREATLTFCAEHFVSCAKEAIKTHGFFSVALSGGSTPKEIYQKVTHPPYSNELNWEKFFLFWSDERSVSPTNSKSNFWMAMEAGFKSVAIPSKQIFRMKAEEAVEENAEAYEKKIKELLGGRPFDLTLLGVGADGHTASLFPKTAALNESAKWVVANPIEGKGERMTLTYPCINRSINTVIYALGAKKQQIIKDIFISQKDPVLPASLIGTRTNKALWVVDTDAGKPLFDALLSKKPSKKAKTA